MTKGHPAWEDFEHSVQDLLDLRSTPGSGNQWHDPSDGRSRPNDSYKLMVDCKHTMKSSYSLNLVMLNQWHDQASTLGFNFVLPVKMEALGVDRAKTRHKEWVVVPIHDYVELVDSIRILNGPKRCGARWTAQPGSLPCCRRFGHFDRHDNGEAEWSA